MNPLEWFLVPWRPIDAGAEIRRLRARVVELEGERDRAERGVGALTLAEAEGLFGEWIGKSFDRLELTARRYSHEQPPAEGRNGFARAQARERAAGTRAAGEGLMRAIAEERARLAPRGDTAA